MTGGGSAAGTPPPAGAYDPLRALGRPGGKPDRQPRFRVLLHKRDWAAWQKLRDEAGEENAQQLWDHLANRPDQPPLLGTCTPLRGDHMKAKNGWSRVYHYEVSGPGRVDYRYNAQYEGGSTGQKHGCTRIISITMGSH
ncbi:MAG TPA: hypothetical protein VFR07_17655 [Mycobacteriales bacterium]|nr:hypothetical protein [Mycobacteriales bacterium]